MKRYDNIFIFPGSVGYLLATSLKRAGRNVLTISNPSTAKTPMPDILGSAVHFPDIFTEDLASFGLPRVEMSRPQQTALYIQGKKVLIDPDGPRQLLAIARALPEFDKRLMVVLGKLESYAGRILPNVKRLYQRVPSKRALGRKLTRRTLFCPNIIDPLNDIPSDGYGDSVRLAIRLPAYLSLGIQGAGGLKALAVGYGLRSPQISSLNSTGLHIEAEHLYLNDGGDALEMDWGTSITVSFFSGLRGVIGINGDDVAFEKAFMSKDTVAQLLGGEGGSTGRIHGLTTLSQSFTWSPPERFDLSNPRLGAVITDTQRPPVNDNLLFYSYTPLVEDGFQVKAAITVERTETIGEHYLERRRDYLLAKIVSNFIGALGGEAGEFSVQKQRANPPFKIIGRGRFQLYEESLGPGNTLEDLVRSARWLSLREQLPFIISRTG